MIKQIRSSLTYTALAMTPLLLSACGPDDGDNKRAVLSLAVTSLLLFVVSMAAGQLKTARAGSRRAA